MKKYMNPTFEMLVASSKDVITASGGGVGTVLDWVQDGKLPF